MSAISFLSLSLSVIVIAVIIYIVYIRSEDSTVPSVFATTTKAPLLLVNTTTTARPTVALVGSGTNTTIAPATTTTTTTRAPTTTTTTTTRLPTTTTLAPTTTATATTSASAVRDFSTNWSCVANYGTPLRLDKDGNVQCVSTDGRNCLMSSTCNPSTIPTNIVPLTCGSVHRSIYGGTGYAIPDHWCNVGYKALRSMDTPVPSDLAGPIFPVYVGCFSTEQNFDNAEYLGAFGSFTDCMTRSAATGKLYMGLARKDDGQIHTYIFNARPTRGVNADAVCSTKCLAANEQNYRCGCAENVCGGKWAWTVYQLRETPTVPCRFVTLEAGATQTFNISEIRVLDENGAVIPAGEVTATLNRLFNSLYPATNLIDGNVSTFGHTQHGPNEWMQIDLGRERRVSQVVITNRTDCCQDRIVGGMVRLRAGDRTIVKQWDINSNQPNYVLPVTSIDLSPLARFAIEQPNRDVAGNDITCLANDNSVEECATRCLNDPNCRAINHVKRNSGHWGGKGGCCLKSKGDGLVALNGVDFYVRK